MSLSPCGATFTCVVLKHDQPTLIDLTRCPRLLNNPIFNDVSQCYCVLRIEPAIWKGWVSDDWLSVPRLSENRKQALKLAYCSLATDIAQHGGSLLIVMDGIEVLAELAKELHCAEIRISALSGVDECKDQARLQSRCQRENRSLRAVNCSSLFAPENHRYTDRQVVTSFADFSVYAGRVTRQSCTLKCDFLQASSALEIEGFFADLDVDKQGWKNDSGSVLHRLEFSAQGAELRCEDYFYDRRCLQRFDSTRLALSGADSSSKLSVFLGLGLISAQRIWQYIDQYELIHQTNESTLKLKEGLLRRDYYHYLMNLKGDSIFADQNWQRPDAENWFAWIHAGTGVPIVDAASIELIDTGYLSERARKVFASFAINELNIDWRWVSAWFEAQLIDYDPGLTWGSCNQIAGAGLDCDPQVPHHLDPIWQSQHHDPSGAYIRRWLPQWAHLDNQLIHQPWKADAPRPLAMPLSQKQFEARRKELVSEG